MLRAVAHYYGAEGKTFMAGFIDVRLETLYLRVLGRLVDIAVRVEAAVGLPRPGAHGEKVAAPRSTAD